MAWGLWINKSYLKRSSQIFTYKIANPLATAGDTSSDDQKLEDRQIVMGIIIEDLADLSEYEEKLY